MKVILNKDLAPLGEEGDVKDVAKGYARNYLFPRGIALPYTEKTIKLFDARKDEIEARKALKRQDASGLKEKLEALSIVITMPAGPNGRLYGAVTGQTIMEELAKQGFKVERKKIELPGNSIKSVGKYKVTVKLYESAQAECMITVEGQAIKSTEPPAPRRRGKREENAVNAESGADTGKTADAESAADSENKPDVESGADAEKPADTGAGSETEKPADTESGTDVEKPALEPVSESPEPKPEVPANSGESESVSE